MIGKGVDFFMRTSLVVNMGGVGVFIEVENDFTKLKN